MLAAVVSYIRKPFAYVGLFAEHGPTELEERLVKRLHEHFREETLVFQERQGLVTQITNNAIELNSRWIYQLVEDRDNFTVGDYVSWKEYKTGADVVIKDVVRMVDKGKFEEKRIYSSKIVQVDGPKYQTDRGVIFYLDKVRFELEFRPVLWDFVNLDCYYLKSETDSEEFDLDPSFVQVTRVSPDASKIVTGKITSWDPSTATGVVNDEIVFSEDVCGQLTPIKGASVTCNCVKGKYAGDYSWRAYSMSKNDASISAREHFFTVERVPQFEVVLGETKTVDLCVSNRSTARPCIVEKIEFLLRNQKAEINHGLKLPYHIMPETTVSWPLEVRGDKLGYQQLRLQWSIAGKKHPISSTIAYRTVQQNLGEPEADPRSRRRGPLVIIPGQRRNRNPIYRRVPMKDYAVPERLREICSEKSGLDLTETQITLNQEKPFLAECLSPQNYADHMHTLLFIEEIAEEKAFERLATRGALYRGKDYITFNFAADSEYSRVVCGDRVRASKPWENVHYEAMVWAISSTQLFLKFNDEFQSSMPSCAQFDLEFSLNRRPHRRRHQAVDLVLLSLGPDWLFPNEYHSVSVVPNQTQIHKWYNAELNVEQKIAVRNILAKKNLPYPYIIYGPPGTGKTVTVVEAILQMISHQTDYRILVTAPTNSAVDTLGIRLLEFGVFDKAEMVRLSSYNAYSSGQIAARLMDISMVPCLGDPAHDTPLSRDEESIPTLYLDDLSRFKIMIGTLATISYLNSAGVPKGFFTHIIIDEAGQCHEPDTLLPIALVQPNKTQLVLAGDPQQLGPTIASVLAKQYCFDQSFLDRLTKTNLYKKKVNDFKDTHGYNPVLITKLVSNYRSLPKIVDVVGSIFYGGDLRPTISEKHSREAQVLRSIIIHRVELKQNMDSLIFINVNTPEEQIEGSMSWMNHGEVAQVFFLLNFLYNAKVSADDIGVITPYALQKKKIYEYLDSLGAVSPKVASVEEFQGQERDVIILSLVRNNLGISKRLSPFVTDSHRVNVALSRARLLNIIVGNRSTLSANQLWAQILSKCRVINLAYHPDPE